MSAHSLAPLFTGAEDVAAEIIRRRSADPPPRDDTAGAVARYHPDHLDFIVTDVIPETATSATFRLRRSGGGDLPSFLAGQYVTIDVSVDGVTTSRPYAISSSPSLRDAYDLTVRRVPGGRVSNYLIDHVGAGDPLRGTAPMGTFHHNPLFHGCDTVFLAGGSGVAPAMCMMRDIAANHPERGLHLLYGSRSADDVIFAEQLAALAAAHPRLRVDVVIEKLLTAETITALAGPLAGRMVYLCGPQAMYPYALAELTRLGHPRRRIRFEANGAPARPERQAGWPSHLDPAGPVTVRVQDGPDFDCARRRPLLDSLEEHGVRPPAGCRSGECGLCRVRIVSGEVFHADEALLRMADVQFGYAHSCVAYPLTDVEIAI